SPISRRTCRTTSFRSTMAATRQSRSASSSFIWHSPGQAPSRWTTDAADGSRFALPDRLLAPGDVGFQFLAHRSVDRRLDVIFQRLLPQQRGARRGVVPAGLLPCFVI